MQGNTVRLRRVVVETPVEKQVSLREEKVIVERRKPTAASKGQDVLTEKAVEMNDSFEVVDAWKSVHLLEEVVLRKEVTERTETVRDTVRRGQRAGRAAHRKGACAPREGLKQGRQRSGRPQVSPLPPSPRRPVFFVPIYALGMRRGSRRSQAYSLPNN